MSETIQSLYDGLSAEKKAAADLIFGALATGETDVDADTDVDGQPLGDVYDSFSDLERSLVDFIAGGIEPNMAHCETANDYLAHHGVKGMHWGVRRQEGPNGRVTGPSTKLSKTAGNTHDARAAAREAVKNNTATLGEAHLAALKSTGHRVANAVLGDKTYWKSSAILAGVALTGVGVALAAPAVLPAGLLASIGAHSVAAGAASAPHLTVAGHMIMGKAAAIAIGKAMATKIGLTVVGTGNTIAGGVIGAKNTTRAVLGNSRINRSYQKLGENVSAHQSRGSAKVQKILKTAGGVKIKHGDTSAIDAVLAHIAVDSGSGGGHGSSKFDESKVKRSKGGQFAKQEGRLPKKPEDLSDKEWQKILDKGWEQNLEGIKFLAMDSNKSKIKEIFQALADKAGISPQKAMDDPAIAREGMQRAVTMMNAQLKDTVSPSGTQKVEFSIKDTGKSVFDVVSRAVPYSGPNPHAYETKTAKENYLFIQKVTRQASQPRDTPMFNPSATLDTSRISDANDPAKHSETALEQVLAGVDASSEENFLKHFGRKGMRWGQHIFTDVQISRLNRKQAKIAEKQAAVDSKQKELDKAGANTGTVRVSVKTAGDTPSEIHISADAERFIRTHQKQGVEMSDREIKEAIQRANITKQYNEIFNPKPDPNSELKAKVEALQLQRDYAQLQAQMRPKPPVQRFISGTAKAFDAYQKVNNATGGEMNRALEQALGLKSSGGKHKSKESAFSGKRKK